MVFAWRHYHYPVYHFCDLLFLQVTHVNVFGYDGNNNVLLFDTDWQGYRYSLDMKLLEKKPKLPFKVNLYEKDKIDAYVLFPVLSNVTKENITNIFLMLGTKEYMRTLLWIQYDRNVVEQNETDLIISYGESKKIWLNMDDLSSDMTIIGARSYQYVWAFRKQGKIHCLTLIEFSYEIPKVIKS